MRRECLIFEDIDGTRLMNRNRPVLKLGMAISGLYCVFLQCDTMTIDVYKSLNH